MDKLAGQSIIDTLLDRFDEFEKGLNGQSKSSIHGVRKNAFDVLKDKGFPAPKDEEYKFTNFTKAIEKNIDFNTPENTDTVSATVVSGVKIENLDAYNCVFVNGKYSAELSDQIDEKGLTVTTFATAAKENTDTLSSYFGKHANAEKDAFVALNTAFSQNGFFIQVDDNVIIDKPIALHFIGDSSKSQSIYNVRNIVAVGKSSQITIIEKFDTIGEHKSFTNVVNEIFVDKNANTKYFKIENDTTDAYHMSNIAIAQERDSTFTANTIALDGAMVRNNLEIKLNGEGCEAYMNGLYLLNGKTHVDNHTVVDHIEPNSYSNELYKGILNDKSKGVFNGKIFVRQEAQKTNAFQSNKNILLTNDATINTKPQLEIWADDVKCSHGCTTGQLDNDALFYLQARGIKKEHARAILLNAFASDVIENLEIEALQRYVEDIISKRLEV
ncbi:Fe-S cluster assembly protein SufD [Roseivirga misakiensis]|uniref:Fe-S cluster assembly protein SufD n=1 Tax=Roseivirga misakiensis TaxID=1563681 RepID=A0A1E5SYM2_9BACT|nr:Fe-S cluster assembly protein SufD [Roseivirga misakiensis]OEK04137.1 Fe-S cluster assembly protein SufD [Roseivirga misakiensis]